LADKAKSKVKLVSETYGNAAQGWFVPNYAVQAGGQAAGLKSITQLNQFTGVLGGRLIDGDPGWVTTQQNTERLKAYGLNYQDVPAGAAAEIGQLVRSYSRKQPILIYLYQPHWVFAKYKLVQLQEPNAYKPGCFTGPDHKCAIPTLSAWIAASDKVAKGAPKFYAMLRRVRISLIDMERMLQQVDVEKKAAGDVAQQWLTAHKAQVDGWIRG
jgi:glycine betaine/proline transport system substrate-binding protein